MQTKYVEHPCGVGWYSAKDASVLMNKTKNDFFKISQTNIMGIQSVLMFISGEQLSFVKG